MENNLKQLKNNFQIALSRINVFDYKTEIEYISEYVNYLENRISGNVNLKVCGIDLTKNYYLALAEIVPNFIYNSEVRDIQLYVLELETLKNSLI